MKKVLFGLILTLVLPLACLRGNAQSLYVGGSFSLSAGQADHYDNSELHSVSFGFDATSKDIFGDLSDITVGFLYHF